MVDVLRRVTTQSAPMMSLVSSALAILLSDAYMNYIWAVHTNAESSAGVWLALTSICAGIFVLVILRTIYIIVQEAASDRQKRLDSQLQYLCEWASSGRDASTYAFPKPAVSDLKS